MREQELVESTENELAERELNWVRKSRLLQTLKELVSVRLAKFGLVVLGIAVIAAVFAPLLSVHDPIKINPRDSLQDPAQNTGWGRTGLGATSWHGLSTARVSRLSSAARALALQSWRASPSERFPAGQVGGRMRCLCGLWTR